MGPSIIVGGKMLQLGDNVRTCNLDASHWSDASIGSESGEAKIPMGWRLANIEETKALARIGAKFGTHVLLHSGCLLGGEMSYPIVTMSLDASKAGQLWSSQWPCTGTSGPLPGSILRQNNNSGRYLLVRAGL